MTPSGKDYRVASLYKLYLTGKFEMDWTKSTIRAIRFGRTDGPTLIVKKLPFSKDYV